MPGRPKASPSLVRCILCLRTASHLSEAPTVLVLHTPGCTVAPKLRVDQGVSRPRQEKRSARQDVVTSFRTVILDGILTFIVIVSAWSQSAAVWLHRRCR